MANPFAVQPFSPLPGLNAFAEGVASRADFERKKLGQQAVENKKAQLAELHKTGTPEEIADFMIKNPDLAGALKAASEVEDKMKADESKAMAWEIYTGKAEGPQAFMERAKEVMRRGGDPAHSLKIAEASLQDPEVAKRAAAGVLARLDPEAFKEYNASQGIGAGTGKDERTATRKDFEAAKAEGYPGTFIEYQNEVAGRTGGPEKVELTASQKDYQFAKAEGFQGSFMDFKQAVSGEGPKTQLEMAKLNAQILDIQDRVQERADKKSELKTIADKKAKTLVGGIDSVIEEVNRATAATKASPTATGVTGAVTSFIPGSPSYDLRKTIDTVKANLGFDKLQAMRDSSPTGGALGQVSERELGYLQSAITALDPNMGSDKLLVGLAKVKQHYENWRATVMGQNPYERVIGETPKFGKVTEGDIQTTMRLRGMTRDQVMAQLGLK